MHLFLKTIFILMLATQTIFSKEMEKVSLQLQWKHQFEFAGFYMAKEKGFYKDLGLDVTFKEFDFGINIVEEVTSKRATFATNYPNVILEKSNGKDVVLLSAILQSSPHALITLKSSGINNLKDFENKTLMIDKGAISAAPFVSMLQSNKVSFDNIKKVPHTFNINDLIDGKVDISTVFTSNEPYYLDQKKIEYKIWDPKDYGFDFYDVLLFTSSSYAEKNPALVSAFRDASLKGWEYAFSNIEESVEIILEKYNTQNRTKDALIHEAKVLKELAYYKNRDLGHIDTNSIQRIFDVYNLLGLTKNTIDLDKFIFKSKEDFKALNLTQEELNFIKKHPVVTVGGEMDWPPFDYVENGKYTGIAKDYLDLIEKYTGLTFDVKTGYTWNELLEMGKNKELDILPMIYYTKDREKYFNYTKEYLTVRNYLFSPLDNNQFSKLEDLNGKTIAFPKGFAQIELLKEKYPKIKILETKNALESIDAVITKKADAFIENIALVSYLLKTNSIKGIKSDFALDIGANSIYMTSRKDWPILRDIIQKGLESITSNEKIQINKKWIGNLNSNTKQVALTNSEKFYLENSSFNVYLNNWLPISKYDKTIKQFSGLSLDYWNKIKELIPINDSLVYTGGFVNSLNKVKEDKNGMMISLSYTEERSKIGNFSKPYVSYPVGIATQDKENFILDLNELEGKKIAVGKNYSAHKLLLKYYPKIKFVPVKNTQEALKLLAQGKVYGAADILLTLKYYLQEYSYTNLKIAGTSDFKFDVRIMVNKENAHLIPIINKAIDKISESDRKLFQNKWIQTIKQVEKIDYTLVYIIVIVFIIVVLFLLWRHKELAKYKNALEEKSKQLHHYIDASTDFVWEIDKNGLYTKVSGKVHDILGYTPSEMIGKSPFDFMTEEEAQRLHNIFQDTLSKKAPILDLQNQNIHKNGSYVYLLANGIPIYKDNEFIGYRGTNKDITEKHQSEKMYKTLLSLASDGIHILNSKGDIVQCSESFANTLGYTVDEALKLNVRDFDTQIDSNILIGFVNELMLTPKLFETKHRKKDGTIIDVQINAKGIEIDTEIYLYASQRDITELKQKDLTILEQSKMVSIGEMIANISHQWRQPLSVISTGATGMLMQKKMNVLDDKHFTEVCHLINDNAQYLSETIDTFTNFIKEDKVLKAHPIEDEISQALNIIKVSLQNNHIELKDNIDYKQKTIVNIVLNELSQVFINIINNAKDILLEREIKEPWIKLDLIKENDNIIITVEDNAGGIDPQVLPRIFEPYFTTKHKSQGTGLGLHMSYRIIHESLGGTLYAKNTQKGAKFIIELPL